MTFQTFSPGDGAALLTNRDAGSTSVVHRSAKAFAASRFWMATRTGAAGHGKRTDSWNVRWTFFTSLVVSHSP